MLRTLQGLVCAALLGALTFFYGSEIYRSTLTLPHQEQRHSAHPANSAGASTEESVQDVSAEVVAYYTKALAWFTGILALVSIGQGVILYKTDRSVGKSANAALELAKAAKIQATEMGKASSLAETQIAIAARQTDIQEKQHALERLQFFAGNRPQLKIHFVRLTSDPRNGDGDVAERFGVINTGTGEGTVTGSSVRLEYRDQFDPPYLPDFPRNDVIIPRRFEVGATDAFDCWGRISEERRVAIANGVAAYLFFAGWVVYEDGRGTARTTYFCRNCHRQLNRFDAIGDPDYEQTY